MGFFKDSDGRVVIAQMPNWQLLSALISLLISKLPIGDLKNLFYALFIILLSFWAYEELINGVNHFRKLLGFLGLLFILVTIERLLK